DSTHGQIGNIRRFNAHEFMCTRFNFRESRITRCRPAAQNLWPMREFDFGEPALILAATRADWPRRARQLDAEVFRAGFSDGGVPAEIAVRPAPHFPAMLALQLVLPHVS